MSKEKMILTCNDCEFQTEEARKTTPCGTCGWWKAFDMPDRFKPKKEIIDQNKQLFEELNDWLGTLITDCGEGASPIMKYHGEQERKILPKLKKALGIEE